MLQLAFLIYLETTRLNTRPQLQLIGPGDVVIRPDLGDIGSADFSRAEITRAIAIGENYFSLLDFGKHRI